MAVAVRCTYSIIDEKGKTSSTELKFQNGGTLADYIELATAFGNLIADVIDGQITKISVTFSVAVSGITALASLGSKVGRKLGIGFRTLFNAPTRFFVPCLDEAKVLTGTDAVDQADADIAALITAVEDGVTDGNATTVNFVDKRNVDITSTSYAREYYSDVGN